MDELAQIRWKRAQTFSEFCSFLDSLRFLAKLERTVFPFPAFEERHCGEALERDPWHEVHLAEAVSLEYVQRPALCRKSGRDSLSQLRTFILA